MSARCLIFQRLHFLNVWVLVQASRQLLAVFPEGGEASKNPAYTCCRENRLGLDDFKEKGFDVIVTSDKEGANSGESVLPYALLILPMLTISL